MNIKRWLIERIDIFDDDELEKLCCTQNMNNLVGARKPCDELSELTKSNNEDSTNSTVFSRIFHFAFHLLCAGQFSVWTNLQLFITLNCNKADQLNEWVLFVREWQNSSQLRQVRKMSKKIFGCETNLDNTSSRPDHLESKTETVSYRVRDQWSQSFLVTDLLKISLSSLRTLNFLKNVSN